MVKVAWETAVVLRGHIEKTSLVPWTSCVKPVYLLGEEMQCVCVKGCQRYWIPEWVRYEDMMKSIGRGHF